MITQQHVARAQVYDRLIANGATAPVYQAATPPPRQPGAAPGAEAPGADRVYAIRPNPRAPFRGNANARVVIEHFSDFQCPFCSRVNPTVQQIAQTYGDRVKIVWRNYPLPFHNNAMPAAEAAMEAYAQQGSAGFWRYHDTLFQNQQAISRENLEQYAQQQGLNMERFRAALDQHTHQAEINDDKAAMDATGAEAGTPASFVNGHLVSGAVPFTEFQQRIDAALNAPPAGLNAIVRPGPSPLRLTGPPRGASPAQAPPTPNSRPPFRRAGPPSGVLPAIPTIAPHVGALRTYRGTPKPLRARAHPGEQSTSPFDFIRRV